MTGSPTSVRLGLIEDHQIVIEGVRNVIQRIPGWTLMCAAGTVAEFTRSATNVDVVLLDLRLGDGSSVIDNVRALSQGAHPVIAFTAGEDTELIRSAARAGVAGIIRKADSVDVFMDVIARVVKGETVATADWASAIDTDSALSMVALSPREREILALYASGETAASIGELTGLSPNTVAKYVGRIRTKYALVGRTALTKIELHLRAAEDGILPRVADTHRT